MWSIAISAVIVALIGALAHFDQTTELAMQHASVAAQAESMAVYRSAVVRYFSKHAGQRDTSVALATLRTEGALRDWSTLTLTPWDNYRGADGTIYVYYGLKKLPAQDLSVALAKLAHNSLTAGTYRQASGTLLSSLHGDTRIPLAPLLAHRSLIDGAPVWLAGSP